MQPWIRRILASRLGQRAPCYRDRFIASNRPPATDPLPHVSGQHVQGYAPSAAGSAPPRLPPPPSRSGSQAVVGYQRLGQDLRSGHDLDDHRPWMQPPAQSTRPIHRPKQGALPDATGHLPVPDNLGRRAFPPPTAQPPDVRARAWFVLDFRRELASVSIRPGPARRTSVSTPRR